MRSTGPDSEVETSATAPSAARAAGRQSPGNKADGEDAVRPRTRFLKVVRCLLLFLAEALFVAQEAVSLGVLGHRLEDAEVKTCWARSGTHSDDSAEGADQDVGRVRPKKGAPAIATAARIGFGTLQHA